ncbi:MAG: hypothetical protein NPIRA02_00590 [Nitrospirales bacterium]|nr:MAG: hypothetical protein NPIRA02_00590 [Nitrospirales bacterium]
MQTFVQIRGLSNKRRLPRLGKIRLGVKVRNPQTGNEHPAETPYFVVPPEVAKVYGDKPTALGIMFPVNDPGRVFPQALKWYGSGRGLKCIGNGETAMRLNDKTRTMEPRECPCEHLNDDCMPRASLQVMLPKVNMGGVYQIDSGSWNSMVDLNSYFDYLTALIGRFAMVPLTLRREPKQIQGPTGLKTHYPLKLELTATQEEVEQLLRSSSEILQRIQCWQIPPPEEINPAKDEEAVVVSEEDWQATNKTTNCIQSPLNPDTESESTSQVGHQETRVPQGSIPDSPARESATVPHPSNTSNAESGQKPKRPSQAKNAKPTHKQRNYILRLTGDHNIPSEVVEARLATMTKGQASIAITQLQQQNYSAFHTEEEKKETPLEDMEEMGQQEETPYEPEF